MAKIKEKTAKKGEEERLEALYKAFLALRDEKECAAFLRDLCTVSEIEAMSERFAVAKLISADMPYRDISAQTGVSTTTITRVAHWLRHGMGGYTSVLNRPLASANKNEGRLKVAVQKSGKLYDASMKYLSSVGLAFPSKEKSLMLSSENSDVDVLFLRDDDIPEYVASGVADLEGKTITKSYPKLLADYLKENDVRASVTVLSGSVEITPGLDLSDAICDLVQTGETLKAHNLVPIATVMDSTAVLIESPTKNERKAEFMEKIKSAKI